MLHEVPQSAMAALLAERPQIATLLSGVIAAHLQPDSAALKAANVNMPQKRTSLAEAMAEHIRRVLAR